MNNELRFKQEFAEDAAAAGVSVYGIALTDNALFSIFHALARKTDGAFYPVFEPPDGSDKCLQESDRPTQIQRNSLANK